MANVKSLMIAASAAATVISMLGTLPTAHADPTNSGAPTTADPAACQVDASGYTTEQCTDTVTIELKYTIAKGRLAQIVKAMSGPPPKANQGFVPDSLANPPYVIEFKDSMIPAPVHGKKEPLNLWASQASEAFNRVTLANAVKAVFEGKLNHGVYCAEHPNEHGC